MNIREKINHVNLNTNLNKNPLEQEKNNIAMKKQTKVIFTFKLALNKLILNFIDSNSVDLIKICYEKFDLNAIYRKSDIEITYSLCDVLAENTKSTNSTLKTILNKIQKNDTILFGDDNSPIFIASILLCEKSSPLYKNERMSMDINFASTVVFLDPGIIRTLCDFFTPNNEFKNIELTDSTLNQINKEANNYLQSLRFNSEEEINAVVRIILTEIKIIFVGQNGCRFSELSIGKSEIVSKHYKEYILSEGTFGNFKILELSNYPFTIKNNNEFSEKNIKQLIGFDNDVSVGFKIRKMHECKVKEDYHCEVTINSLVVNYVHEPFIRIINFMVYIQKEFRAVDITKSIEKYLAKQHVDNQFIDWDVRFIL